MNDVGEYPNQRYGWEKGDDGSWSLYAPDGTKVIGTAGNNVQVPTPVGTMDAVTKAYADAASGGGSMPGIPLAAGPAWAPDAAVTEGYQITASYLGQSRVWEATNSGTTNENLSFPDELEASVEPLAETPDGDLSWRYLGIVGEISYQYLPAPGIVAESGYYSSGNTNVDGGSSAFLAWDVWDSGADVLDLSVPAHPVARKSGVFFVSAEVQVVASDTDLGLELTFDYTGEAVPIGGGGIGFANVNGSYRVPAGGQIRLQARNGDVAAQDIKIINAHVSRVGPG